ncbi:MAG: hypothetical protein ABIR06_03300 [Cyclobacteriaceae bacterium]
MIHVKINKAVRIIIFLTATAFILSSANAKKIPGQIVDRQGNILEVIFNIPFGFLSSEPNFEKIQYRIAYYDAMKNKRILKPDEASEIIFNNKKEEIRMLSRPNSIGAGSIFFTNTHIFLRLKIDGKLKLFNYYYTQNSTTYNSSTGAMTGSHPYTFAKYVLQIGEETLLQPRGLAFRKDMLSYIIDCPEVIRMIEERELRKGDLEIIVQQYNAKCSGN